MRIHRGQTLSTPGYLQSKKRKKERDPHSVFLFSNRSCKQPEISNKTDPTYRNEENRVTKAGQWLSFLCLLCWPDSCRGIPGEESLKGRSMGMGGVNQQNKRQLQSEAKMKKATEGQGWSKCQHTEEMVPLQSKKQKGHSVGDKAVPSLPSSCSSFPYLLQGGSRTPALV